MNELLQKVLDAVKGLTWVNVGVLAALVIISIPAYFAWKAINNPQLMGAMLSEFREIQSETDCNLFYLQGIGAPPMWAITNQFAQRNAETWSVTVRIKFEPDAEAMKKYCAALESVVDYMRDADMQPPHFPDSNRMIIWREHHPQKDQP